MIAADLVDEGDELHPAVEGATGILGMHEPAADRQRVRIEFEYDLNLEAGHGPIVSWLGWG